MRLKTLVLFCMAILSGTSMTAYASCGSATCPIDTLSADRGGKDWVRLGYDFEYIDQDQPRIGRSKASVGEIPGDHDEIYTVNRVHRLTGSFGLTDRLSADLILPYVSRSHQHIDNEEGSPMLETWDISGIGDFTAQARYAFYKPEIVARPMLSAILGGKFPTGAHHEINDEGSAAEPGVQPGSGSYDLIFGAGSLQRFSVPMLTHAYGTMPFFVTATYQRNGRGIDDYKLGNVFLASLGTSYPLSPAIAFATQLNLRVKEPDERGETTEQTERTGGEFVYFSPGLEVRLGEHWQASLLVQLPVYQRVNQIQVTSDYNLLSSLSYRFQL